MKQKINFSILDIQKDLPQILAWDNEFWDDPNYYGVRRFILGNAPEDSQIFSGGITLNKLFKTRLNPKRNDDVTPVVVVAKAKDKVVGFVIAEPGPYRPKDGPAGTQLAITEIVAKPKYQRQGVGGALMQELINNSQKYIGEDAIMLHAYIDEENDASIGMFTHVGFNIGRLPNGTLWAQLDNPKRERGL